MLKPQRKKKSMRLILKTFVKIPSGFLAEPFEIFLVVLGLLDSALLLFHNFSHTAKPVLAYYHGPIGLIIWAGAVLIASLALVWSLATMGEKNLLAVRKLEIGGMLAYAVAFAYYGYSNLAVNLSLHMSIFDIVANAALFTVLVGACLGRALTLSSQITALSVTRVHRVKEIKAKIKESLDRGDI